MAVAKKKKKVEPYIVNVSSVQDFMACRFRWWCKWVMNRVPREESPALGAGKLLHLIFEDHHRTGKPLAEAARLRSLEWTRKLPKEDNFERRAGEKALKIIEDLSEAFPLWKDKYEFTIPVLDVEEPFEIGFKGCPNVIFRGRPDRNAVMNNSVWHIQNRGLAAATNFGLYIELAKRHYHEHLYAEANARKYPKYKVGGTFFNLVRKLKFRTKITKKNPLGETKTANEMFFQHPMAINLKSGVHRHVMESLFQHVREMMEVERAWKERGLIPAPNEKMNGGAFGNTIDPYFKVLIGEITLSDDAFFKDREDTYAPSNPSEGD